MPYLGSLRISFTGLFRAQDLYKDPHHAMQGSFSETLRLRMAVATPRGGLKSSGLTFGALAFRCKAQGVHLVWGFG